MKVKRGIDKQVNCHSGDFVRLGGDLQTMWRGALPISVKMNPLNQIICTVRLFHPDAKSVSIAIGRAEQYARHRPKPRHFSRRHLEASPSRNHRFPVPGAYIVRSSGDTDHCPIWRGFVPPARYSARGPVVVAQRRSP
ncbi:hypothetical protein KCP75_04325 [Salmonella enterica subsp. enterica]|nr:hypothetical protein KCP75_04325 [Salmonella enterica subsp. enterica]